MYFMGDMRLFYIDFVEWFVSWVCLGVYSLICFLCFFYLDGVNFFIDKIFLSDISIYIILVIVLVEKNMNR